MPPAADAPAAGSPLGGPRAAGPAHPWLAPSAAVVAKVLRARAMAALRGLSTVRSVWLGPHAAAWQPLLAALPALLRADPGRVLDAAGRIDVLPVLLLLAHEAVDAAKIERALVTFWLGLAGHPGLTAPLVLPGPFSQRAVDPRAPRLLALADARGLVATARGPVVVGRDGRLPVDAFVAAPLPTADGTVIVDEWLGPPDSAVVAHVHTALTLVRPLLPGGRLERVTIGAGDAEYGEARVGADADPADLVASAQAAFVRAAATIEPPLGPGAGVLVEQRRRLSPVDLLARTCGNAVALPRRADGAAAASAILADLDDLAVLAQPTASGASLVEALHTITGARGSERRRALLVNVDADDFVYSFQFGQSVERRCVERGLRVDRIGIDGTTGRDLAAELGQPVPPPIADGVEFLVTSDNDPVLASALRRLSTRRYEVVVANVRPRLFYDLVATGLLAAPTLLWDRHLHNGLREEHARRGPAGNGVGILPIRVWSPFGESLNAPFAKVGIARTLNRTWAMDLDFFRSTVIPRPDRLFAGGDSGRDWPLFVDAVRELPLDVHLVTSQAPAALPLHVHAETHLSLCRFRDAMAAATVTAIPIADPRLVVGITVLTMAMALGVAVVATHNIWIAEYVTDGEEALLVPPGDVHAFRNALLRLYEDPELRARLVANARRRVAALCDLEALTGEMFSTLKT
jgi:hypothetical protein